MIKAILATGGAFLIALALFIFLFGQAPIHQQKFKSKFDNCTDSQYIEENIKSGQEYTEICARGLADMQTNIERDAVKSVVSPLGYVVEHVKEIPTAVRNALGGEKKDQ